MIDLLLTEQVLIACLALTGVAIVAAALLRGWQSWLALKERELALPRHEPTLREPAELAVSGAARIELADLKERVRKLEAIASGVDL